MWDSVFWLVAVAVFVAVEAMTTALVSVWFAVGAAAALLLSFTPVGVGGQALAFAVVSAAVLALVLPRLVNRRGHGQPPVTNGSPLTIGKQGTVLKRLTPGNLGRVHVDGLDWQARSAETMEVGAACRVRDVDGFILIVEPVPVAEPAAR